MAEMSLMFQTFSAIHNKSSQLYQQASAIECKKERKKHVRKLKHEPIVRLYRIISAAAGHKCKGIPKNLSKDELALKYTLDNCPSVQLALREFRRRVLRPARETLQFERRWCQLSNLGNQHPDPYPYPNEADEVLRELSFRESDEYLEMGKTYWWYIHRYDEIPAFARAVTHGNCQSCDKALPVWRSCFYCAFAYFIDDCEDIYVKCLECSSLEHQIDLEEVTKCRDCGGPPDIVVTIPRQDTGRWMDDENWD